MKQRASISIERKRELEETIRAEEQRFRKTLRNEFADGTAQITLDADVVLPDRHAGAALFDAIEEAANLLPASIPIRLVLRGVTEPERACIAQEITAHYRAVMQDRLWDKQSNFFRMVWMAAIGLAFLAAYFVLTLTLENPMFLELLSIIGSFSLWEAASCFLVERRAIRRQLREAAQYLTMEVAAEAVSKDA